MFFHLSYGIKRRIHTRASNEGKVSRNRNRIISFSVKMNVLSILQSFSPKQTICSVHFAASLTHNFWDRNFNEKSSNAFSLLPKRFLSLFHSVTLLTNNFCKFQEKNSNQKNDTVPLVRCLVIKFRIRIVSNCISQFIYFPAWVSVLVRNIHTFQPLYLHLQPPNAFFFISSSPKRNVRK